MRRTAPRPIGEALTSLVARVAPQTLIARVQRAWPASVGEVVAAEAEPVSERAGTVTVACRSAVWAQELSMLAPDLQQRLNEALGAPPGRPFVRELRFQIESPSRRP
jgi:predicted nucleic acid-binding Zn ribbon protein